MKLKKTLLVSSMLLLAAACTDKDNNVKVEMTNCEGTECSFDASKSKIKSHSQVLEYDWQFHDDTDMEVTKEPKVKHDFNIHLGATLDGNDSDLDLREVTLDEVLTNHHVVSKTFKFRTHQHDPKAMFLAKKSETLGLHDGSQLLDLDASESEAGQGNIKEYIWQIDGEKTVTETPELKHQFTDKSSGDVTLTVVNSFGVENSATENVANINVKKNPVAKFTYSKQGALAVRLDASASTPAVSWLGKEISFKSYIWQIDDGDDTIVKTEDSPILDYKFGKEGVHKVKLTVVCDVSMSNIVDTTWNNVTIDTVGPTPDIFVKQVDGLKYHFDSINSKAGDAKITSYTWAIEDGGEQKTFTTPSVDYTFSKPGKKHVYLNVKDENGLSEDKEIVVDAFDAVAPSFSSDITYSEVKDSDGLHYDFDVNTKDFDASKYSIVWSLNDKTINTTKNVEVLNGSNIVKAEIISKDGDLIATTTESFTATAVIIPAFTSELSATEVKDSDGLHYDFAVDTNDYDKSKYDLVYKLNGKVITETKNVVVREGANTVVAQLVAKDGTVAAEKSTSFTATAVVTPAFTSELSATEVKDSDGLHYDFAVDTNDYDKSKYDLVYKLNGNVITETKNVVVSEGANTVLAQLVAKDGTVAAEKSTPFTATAVITPAFTSELSATEVKDSDGLHYDFAVDTNDYDKSKYDLVYKLNGKVITETKNVVVSEGANTVLAQLVAKDGTVAAEKSTPFTATAVITPAFTSELSATEVKDSDGLHYDFAVDTNDYDKSKYDLVYKLNGNVITETKNVVVSEGANTVLAQLVAKDGTVAAEKSTPFTAKSIYTCTGGQWHLPAGTSTTTMWTDGGQWMHINGIEVCSDNTFNYTPSAGTNYWGQLSVPSNKTFSKEVAQYCKQDNGCDYLTFGLDYAGQAYVVEEHAEKNQKVERSLGNNAKGLTYIRTEISSQWQSSPIIEPEFTSELSAIEVKDSDGLHYDFAVDTNDYDTTKYDLVFELNGAKLTTIKNVLVKEGENTVLAKLVAKDGNVVNKTEPKTFNAKTIKPVPAILSVEESENDPMTFNFKGNVDYNGRKADEFETFWMLDGSSTFSTNELNVTKTFSSTGHHALKLVVRDKTTKVEYKTSGYSLDVLGPRFTKEIEYQPVRGGDGFHYDFNIETKPLNLDFNKYYLVWTLNGKQLASRQDAPVNTGSNTVKVELKDVSGKVLAIKDKTFNVGIPYESTPKAKLDPSNLWTYGRGSQSFGTFHMTLNNQPVKFVKGSGQAIVKKGKETITPNSDSSDSEIIFNTSGKISTAGSGYGVDFKATVSYGAVKQDISYSCKYRNYSWEGPAIEQDSCSSISWGEAYK